MKAQLTAMTKNQIVLLKTGLGVAGSAPAGVECVVVSVDVGGGIGIVETGVDVPTRALAGLPALQPLRRARSQSHRRAESRAARDADACNRYRCRDHRGRVRRRVAEAAAFFCVCCYDPLTFF